MAIQVFLTLCGLGVGFLVYVLVQFRREGRRSQGNSKRDTVFSRSSNPNLIVVARPVSLSEQGGISVMPLQPRALVPPGNSAPKGCRTAPNARLLQMPSSGVREARQDAAGATNVRNSWKAS